MTPRTFFFSLILLTALIASVSTASATVAFYDDFSTDPATNGNWVNVTNITWSSASQLVKNALSDTTYSRTFTGADNSGTPHVNIDPSGETVFLIQVTKNPDNGCWGSLYLDGVNLGKPQPTLMVNQRGIQVWLSHGYGTSHTYNYSVYYKKILTGVLLSRDITLDEINNKGNILVYSGSPSPVVDILDKNGTVWQSNVQSGFDLSALTTMPENFPIKIRVTLYDPNDETLDYIQIIPNKYFGYVYDSSGKAAYRANIKLQHLVSYSEPSYTGGTVSGTGNITLVVYKDGQPLQNALIKVTNPWGMNYISSSATNANGVVNITGLDSQSGWTPTSNYTFQVFDLNANPVYDSLGNELKVTIPFIDGIPQTNPGKIYNSLGQDEELTIQTDLNGYFETTALNTSRSYHVTITDSNGNLLYEDDISPPFYKEYGAPANGGGNNGGTGGNATEPVYGDPNSKYYIELSSSKINPGETVKIYVKEKKNWWLDSYVEGAEIYLDGQPTGKTTQKHTDWAWLFWWVPFWDDVKPYAEIQINDPGTHYIHAVINGVKSQQASIQVGNQTSTSTTGGSSEGTYPGTQPVTDPSSGKSYTYKLFADKTTLYLGGSVTFKVFKLESGQVVDTVKGAMIYIDGNYAGTTGGLISPGFHYTFSQPGQHTVYAVVNGQQTGELIITVLDTLKEKPATDISGQTAYNLNVKVMNTQKQPLSGITVLRSVNGQTAEQKITDSAGTAILTVPQGKNHIIIADPSNNYLPVSKYLNVTSDMTFEVMLFKAGDLNNNNQTDPGEPVNQISSITVRVDGYTEAVELYKGRHNIEVVDDTGRFVRGAKITIDDQEVGETSGWWSPKLTYDFQQPGEHTITAEYNGMADIIRIKILDQINPNDPNAPVLLARLQTGKGLIGDKFSDSFIIGNISIQKGQKVFFEVAKQDSVNSIWDWSRYSNAQIYVNGTPVGVTAKTGLFGRIGYIHTFEQNGTFDVYAKTTDGQTTQTIYVTVGNQSFTGDTGSGGTGSFLDRIPVIGGILGQIAGSLAESYPLLGISTVDTLIYAIALILIGLAVITGVIRWIF